MSDMITLSGEELRTSTARLAEWFALDHLSVMKTVKRFEKDFIKLGKIEESKDLIMDWQSQIRNKKSKVLLLNEMQVNFFWTLTNNTERSVEFKLKLVQEFDKYRKTLLRLKNNQATASFVWALPEWKAIRRTLTDAIQDYNDYRVQRGMSKDEWIYSNITKLVNTKLFDFENIDLTHIKNKRDLLSEKQRRKLADTEDDLVEIIIANIEDPYAKVKEYLEMRLKFISKSVVIDDQLNLLN